MAAKVTFALGPVSLNLAAFRELRKSPEMQKECDTRAKRWAEAAGDGYEWEQSPGRNRARSTVYPNTPKAQHDDLAHLTMIKTMGAARG